jgi:hypothetical protein
MIKTGRFVGGTEISHKINTILTKERYATLEKYGLVIVD